MPRDRRGRQVETPSSRSFTIDRAAPQTTIDSNPTNPSRRRTARPSTFSSSEGSSTFECRLDGGAWGACTSPQTTPSLTDGSHTFDVRATDVAGNIDASPASYTWVVDTARPSSTVSLPGRRRHVQHRRLEHRLRHERLLRHVLGRHRVRRRPGAGLDPPGRGQLLERLRLRKRRRGLEHRDDRRRQLVAGLPGRELPGRRQLHGARARGRRRREHGDALQPDVHDRPHRPADDDRLQPADPTELDLRRASTSPRTRAAPRSSAASTAAPGAPAPARRATRPHRRQPHLRRARHRRRRQHRRHPRHLHLARRHDGAVLDARLPGRRGELHRRRVGRGLRHGRPLRHLLATAPARASPRSRSRSSRAAATTGTAPASPASTEVWNDADLAAGDWSYDLDSSDFPADGDYTVRVRARDDVGNTEAPSSRTFEVDKTDPSSALAFPGGRRHLQPGRLGRGLPRPRPLRHLLRRHLRRRRGRGLRSSTTAATTGTAPASPAPPRSGTTPTSPAGDWSYDFPAANLPVDGEYAVRVRANDAAGNTSPPPAGRSRSTRASPRRRSTRACPTRRTRRRRASTSPPTSPARPSSAPSTAAPGARARARRPTPACRRRPQLRGARHRSRRQHRRQPGRLQLDDRHGRPDLDGELPGRLRQLHGRRMGRGLHGAGSLRHLLRSGVGVVDVEVSIRRGNGNYWNGTGFSSATEVWNDATLAGGDWTYEFDAADFPADGSYTVRVRARDDAGNTETPSSRTFDFDATAPSSTLAFPAAAGTYNAAGWAAGCATDGLCGTYADGPAPASPRSRSPSAAAPATTGTAPASRAPPRSGTTRPSPPATGRTASIPSDFPADGDYTVRVRATDVAGNIESASSRTFTYDTTAPQTTIDSSPTDPTSSTDGRLRLLLERGRLHLRVPHRRRRLGRLHQPEELHEPDRRQPHLRRARHRQAGNTDASPASFTWLVDTTAPSSTTNFPAPGGEYNAAGWDAGCATSGLCGTYGDGSGSGVAEVEVSIRRGTGNYWNGTGFSSATEVWNDASLAAGDWSYDFDAADFPADGTYTVRVRATDEVGNARPRRAAPSSTTRPTRARSSPSPQPAASTARRLERRLRAPSASAAPSPTRAPASPRSRSASSAVTGDLLGRRLLRRAAPRVVHGDPRRRQLVVSPSRRPTSRPTASTRPRARDRRRRQHRGRALPHLPDRQHRPERALHLPRRGHVLLDRGLERRLRDRGLCGTQSDSGSGVARSRSA